MGRSEIFSFVARPNNQLTLTKNEILTLLKEGREYFTCSAIDGLLTGTWQCLYTTKLTKHDMIITSLGQFCKHSNQDNETYIMPVYKHQNALTDIFVDDSDLFIDAMSNPQSSLSMPKGIYTFNDVYIVVLDKVNFIYLANFL